ncbi:MAG: GDP-mannose 4,6-dehydratase [Actinomycetota bacterium]|jgi:GDPmannose 4,6-dehydratase
MHALITGVAGQDGTLLSELLITRGWKVTGSRLPDETVGPNHPLNLEQLVTLDVRDRSAVLEVVKNESPDVIFHFAGITSVGFSIQNPELTCDVNIGGTKNILEALRSCGLNESLMIHAASTEIFDKSTGAITELSPLDPQSPYAESKAKAFQMCIEYRNSGLSVTNAILSNHESYLRSADFVTGKIALGVAKIAAGLQLKISLGNTDVEKDWSAASDVVEGLLEIADQKFVGDVILASGTSTNLQDFIREAFAHVGISDWQSYIETDESLIRTGEGKQIQIDPSKAMDVLGWRATTPMSVWVGEMVDYHIATFNA